MNESDDYMAEACRLVSLSHDNRNSIKCFQWKCHHADRSHYYEYEIIFKVTILIANDRMYRIKHSPKRRNVKTRSRNIVTNLPRPKRKIPQKNT